MTAFVVLSGCSGGGKSTLLQALARRGHTVVPEPGRRIVAEELAGEGRALPWQDPYAFARRAVQVAVADIDRIRSGRPQASGWVFFDRSVVDAVTALRHQRPDAPTPAHSLLRGFHHQVFMVPPWREIYVADAERRHSFADAVAEHDRLTAAYEALGYAVVTVPRVGVEARTRFVESALVK